MYFDPYVIGLIMGVLGTLAAELLLLLIGALISSYRRKWK